MGGGTAGAAGTVYCVVPHELGPQLHDLLRRHFRDSPDVEVVVEWRALDRRENVDRRSGEAGPPADERRLVRRAAGRRVADRRAITVAIEPRPLPRAARRHAERIQFVELLAPQTSTDEDHEAARLVTRFQAGDHAAFDAIYLRYFERIYSYLRVLLRDPHEAEDIAQTTFGQVFRALPDYEDRGRPFRAWLFVIARNTAYRQLELTQRHAELRAPDELPEVSGEQPDPEESLGTLRWVSDSELMLFIERLPLAQRQVLFLRFVMDLSHQETAVILGRSPEAVRRLQFRGLTFVRERLEAIGRCGSRRRGRHGMRLYPPPAPVLRGRLFALNR